MSCKKCEWMMELYIHEELSKPDKISFEEHLSHCKNCAQKFNKIKQVISKIDSITNNLTEPDWDKSWQIIKRNVEKKPGRKKFSFYFPSFNWRLAAAYSIFIFILGLAAGKILFFSPRPGNIETSSSPQNIQLAMREYIEDIKPLIIEYVNYQPIYKNKEDIAFDKELALQLLNRNRNLQHRMSRARNNNLQQLLKELEIILMEISKLSSNNEYENLFMIKKLIQIKRTIYKLEALYLERMTKKIQEV